jgi:predicted AAA+ superfamily ATPase
LLQGARQVGKSTLARSICEQAGGRWVSLDLPDARRAAAADPVGFVEAKGRLLVIDEVQREPELALTIKERVDREPRPGQFLLTGSARVMALRSIVDSLPGRMETVELWPLSQGELSGGNDRFIDAVFEAGPDLEHRSALSRADYVERVARGGYPEAVRRSGRRQERFFDQYLTDLIARNFMEAGEVRHPEQMVALARMVAARSGQLLVPATLGSALGLPHPTVARYLSLLDQTFLIKRVSAWTRNVSSRAAATPKVAMVDSGLAAHLTGVSAERLSDAASAAAASQLGGLLEGFGAMELARQATWAQTAVRFSHYRTKDGAEVDLILEDRRGRVVGLEFKATATARPADFNGLRHLQDKVGADWLVGIALHLGRETLSFGPKLKAMPLAAIWEV